MLLSFLLLCILLANGWLAWTLAGLTGIGIFAILLPITIFILIGGALALGLIGLVFGKPDDRSKTKRFFSAFFRGWAGLLCFVWIAPWLLFGIVNLTNLHFPAALPKITISNGEKTVVFQSMMHIASPGFYQDIESDMRGLVGQDYVFFYEGVQAGSEASMKELSALMGTEVSEDMYDMIAEMARLKTQGNTDFEGILPSMNVDLTTDEIVALAKAAAIVPAIEQETIIIEDLKKRYPGLTDMQKNILEVFARGMMNGILRTYTHPDLLAKLEMNVPVMDIIVNARNKHLADAIIQSPAQKIYIHYGALHYAGVLEELKKQDPRWQEVARTGLTVIR